jgi:hypothetical protein
MKKILSLMFIFSATTSFAVNEMRFSEYHKTFFQIEESKIKINDKIQLAGDQTKIEEILAIREHSVSHTLLVQHRKEDQTEEVLFFDLKELGLIQPHRVLGESSLQNSVDLDLDQESQRLYILQHFPARLTILDAQKNRLSRGEKAQMHIIHHYPLSIAYKSMALMEQNLMALLTPEGKIHFYNISSMELVQEMELQLIKETLDSVTLQWRSDLKELHLIQNLTIIERLGF